MSEPKILTDEEIEIYYLLEAAEDKYWSAKMGSEPTLLMRALETIRQLKRQVEELSRVGKLQDAALEIHKQGKAIKTWMP